MPVQSVLLCHEAELSGDMSVNASALFSLIERSDTPVHVKAIMHLLPYAGQCHEEIIAVWKRSDSEAPVSSRMLHTLNGRDGGATPQLWPFSIELPVQETGPYVFEVYTRLVTEPPSLPDLQLSLPVLVMDEDKLHDEDMTIDAG